MDVVGHVENVWRYPVKGMRGEKLEQGYLGFAGVYGDRCYAIHSDAAARGFPFFTAQHQAQMLLYRPGFRFPDLLVRPSSLQETQEIGPGLTPLYPKWDEALIDVETPEGDVLCIDDPELLQRLAEGNRSAGNLSLLRSWRSMTDCRPVSIFSVQTIRKMCCELGRVVEAERFRANLYIDFHEADGFIEESFLGKQFKIGDRAVVAVVHRDVRCKVVTLNPHTGQADPDIMRYLARGHGGAAGVYGVVMEEGLIQCGDQVHLLG